MKTIKLPFFASLLLASGLVIATPLVAATETPSGPKPADLQIQVSIPAPWLPMLQDDISDLLYTQVTQVFQRRGFEGTVGEVRSYQEPNGVSPLLKINLTDWQMDRMGTIECSFTATLSKGDVERNLGIFRGIAFRWASGPGRFGLGNAFGNAAENALFQVYDAIARTELVPGLRLPSGG